MKHSATSLLMQHSDTTSLRSPTETAGDFPASTTIPHFSSIGLCYMTDLAAETFAKARPPPGQLDMFQGWSGGPSPVG